MNANERLLEYPFGDTLPAAGSVIEVAPGVRWIRMGLPFALDHINLWLLRDRAEDERGGVREGWTVVDCCIAHDASRAQWEQLIAHELDGLPVLRVIVTHMHPDHVGLAGWLCERFGAPLYISATDYHVARQASLRGDNTRSESTVRFYAQHGVTDAVALQALRDRGASYPRLVGPLPEQFHRLQDGTQLTIGDAAWRCISGFGHAPEHMALHCESLGVLISGDMLLPRISTNISVYDTEPEADSLRQFLESIDRFGPLAPHTLVLPSHGRPFRGLHERVAQLHAHHAERLDEVLRACAAAPRSAAEIMPVLFPRALDPHQTTFALGEALAHLHRLWFARRLQRLRGADGIWRFTATAATAPT
ncbi:MAG: MBL fold metallo-hydrolase [Betaproteobacteria bacterium]|jgi:glyoxylase-like metal-dependent hydrolase (beta-lactamase superfamily II)|nr:MBL fold metallo-hydrolase [Betaproteobacteria bacterium]